MRKLEPETVRAMLQAKGMDVTMEQAAKILAFLRTMANIVVAQYLRKKSVENMRRKKTHDDSQKDKLDKPVREVT